jgi:protein TonB
MLISKFNLCKSEWLELVFVNRNKEYGAYYLRQHHAGDMIKAMGITFLGVVSIALTLGFIVRVKPAELFKETVVHLTEVPKQQPAPPKKEEIHQAKASAPKTLVATTEFVPPVVVSQPVTVEPPKLADMKGEVGQENIVVPEGTGAVTNINDGNGNNGTAVKVPDGNEVHTMGGVDVEPEPYGGAAGWAKFLQKNLRYPAMAMDQQASGKVWVTFIVEKDGHISSLTVLRGAGYGMDEEALRVLKMAAPWKPGMQHGNPVRVKYTLPLNFVLNN